MNKEPAQKGLIELTDSMQLQKVCLWYSGMYMQTNELCSCMADESCLNPENVSAVDDDDI